MVFQQAIFILLFVTIKCFVNGFYEEGPNVCVIELFPQISHRIFYDCKNWKPRTVCGQKPILKYECCEGYSHLEGTPGCSKVNPLKNVLETARKLGASKFVRYIESSGVLSQFVQDGAITLFAPHDEAVKLGEKHLKHHLQSFTTKLDNLINYHTIDNRLKSSLFDADMLVNTKFGGHKIRINKFSSWINTVNCAIIANKDNEATNGIVHIIDSVLDPDAAPQRNVADILLQDGRFNIFSQAMENTGISKTLRKSKFPVTILAPTDTAFKQLKNSNLRSILNDDKAGEALIKTHIIPHTLCSAAIIGKHNLKTQSKDKITIECDQNGVSLGNVTYLKEFISGENGLVYVSENVLLPDRANNLMKLLEEEQLQTFLKLIKFARLEETFEEAEDYTLFVPSESAMSNIQQHKLQELYLDMNQAKRFILHHGIQGRLRKQEIFDNQVLKTLDEIHSVRFHIHRKNIGIDGSIIEKANREGRNGILHIISKPLFPIIKEWENVLRQNGTYSIFLEAILKTHLRNEIQLNLFKTLFIPTNQAFQKLDPRYLENIMKNTTYLTEILQNHLLYSFVTSESLQNDLFYYFPTVNGNLEIIKENNEMTVNNVLVTESDILAQNVVIHEINEVILNIQK